MRNFTKVAKLHRMFFKRAAEFPGDDIDEMLAVQHGKAHPGPPKGPDEGELANASNWQQKFDNNLFANPFGPRSGASSGSINTYKSLRPNNILIPPSAIQQPKTLPTNLRQPPFIMPASPTDGLQ